MAIAGAFSTRFTIINHCPYTIWPASLTSSGPQIITGFELASGASRAIDTAPNWSGRFWARFVCSNSDGKFSCKSGDCGSNQIECGGRGGIPPATLAEFTLRGADGKDFYDISLVDGFNLPVTIAPQDGGCPTISCPVDINNRACPKELSIYNTDGGVIGCKSACIAFNQPQYCCTGDFSTPDKCKPTYYSEIFKQQCPQSYTYAYDDPSSLFTCQRHPNYVITFCP
ncbi:OLC1v1034438C2 [Oldenlandia corymbosa var. corymbosa]|uniref:OLC1v1034438C2 n=1 Tax=Oldenlandia corymbosa var. corymbosa TaxID=529605 RepID=A0AAV1CQM3_OLDCO|nr:OLC1v1034438C2 [Oldenlandia corymbosa var. corymbosa]